LALRAAYAPRSSWQRRYRYSSSDSWAGRGCVAIEKDFADEKIKNKRYQKIMKSPYFNALQVKYAHAVTVHKAQGGQWKHVYIDYGFIPEEMKSKNYLRWLYTSVTRATEKLCFLNFPKDVVPSR
jgi:exodeoxyribonuclease-5